MTSFIGHAIRLCAPLAVAAATGATTLRSQPVEEPRWWVNLGLGGSSLGSIAGSVEASAQIGHNLLALRGTENSAEIFGDSYWDVAATYGYATIDRRWLASAGLGVAVVGGVEDAGLFSKGRTLAPIGGVALDAQAFYRPLTWMGIGVHAYADFNARRSFTSATICLQVGWGWDSEPTR